MDTIITMDFVRVTFLLVLTACKGTECVINSNDFKRMSCANEDVRGVLNPEMEEIQATRSLITCTASCNEKRQCQYAIFRDVTKSCYHVQYGSDLSQQPPAWSTEEADCFVLRKGRPVTCENGGTSFGDFVCKCPFQFTGRYCQEPTPLFCQNRDWKDAEPSDYATLSSSLNQIKLQMISDASKFKVYPINYFNLYKDSNEHVFLSNHYLAQDNTADSFRLPIARELKAYFSSLQSMTKTLISLNGTVTDIPGTNQDFKLKIRDAVDNDPILYQQSGNIGDVGQIVEGLSKGYRLLSREFSRVGFDSREVFVEEIRTHVGLNSAAFNRPLYYFSKKDVLMTGKSFVVRTRIASGEFYSASISTLNSKHWELDRCWSRLPPTRSYQEFTGVLQETVLQGRDVRLVIGGSVSVSTDVSIVTITSTDVIATLADYMTPFDATSPLDKESTIVFSHISRSGLLAECEMAFQGNKVHDLRSRQYDSGTNSDLQWYASSRPSVEVLHVDSEGVQISGSVHEVYRAAKLGKDIRVCVELVDEDSQWLAVCSGARVVSATSAEDHVTVQTPSRLGESIGKDGKFAGISDPDCKQNVWLVSTEGWIKSVAYRLGVVTPVDDTPNTEFNTITWFIQ